MKLLKQYAQTRETYLGLAVAVAFQMIFFIVWLTAYDGVDDRVDQVEIGMVVEDEHIGATIEEVIGDTDELSVLTYGSIEKAEKALDQKELAMIMYVEEDFTEQLTTKQRSEIGYYIDQSNPRLLRQLMEGIAQEVTDAVNQELFGHVNQEMMPEQVFSKMNIPEETEQMAQELVATITDNLTQHPVEENIVKLHNREGFAESMVPLMIVLASFIGAMLISQHLQFAEEKIVGNESVIQSFLVRQCMNVFAAMTIASLTIGLLLVFQIDMDKSLFSLWGFQALLFFSFLTLSQVFVLVLGNVGMLFNIVLVAMQLATSGALVPRALLSETYQRIGDFLPATYGTNGYFTFIYGGVMGEDVRILVYMIGWTLLLGIIVVLCKVLWGRKRKAIKE